VIRTEDSIENGTTPASGHPPDFYQDWKGGGLFFNLILKLVLIIRTTKVLLPFLREGGLIGIRIFFR